MLQLKDISKTYKTGELVQKALDGFSLSLRDNEFVSVLGPSGSGKTTLLNIIGGLDRYDSGDLVINGVSTKMYKDRDWDTYRNHTIGFVFQSYNLIPHQSILSNVELALTIGGISRGERKKRAKAALKEVGLEGQEHKKPNQMSGGQMQRVAIARALVNDPDILLADEPTGALDSETSIQIMGLLKKVAEKRLVVMVTHNSELAEAYSTRIVKLRDGKITDDSDPYYPEEEEQAAENRFYRKSRMSFGTSLSLSAQNLRTKKGRTLLTAFAGSIGIIGIALILSLSTGVNKYIADVQKDTMASYPIQINARTIDLNSIMQNNNGSGFGSISARDDEETDEEKTDVGVNYRLLEAAEAINSSITENDLTAFKKYLEDHGNGINEHIGENGVVYTYDVNFEVYTYDPEDSFINTNTEVDEESSSSSGTNDFGSMWRMNRDTTMLFFGATGNSEAKNFSVLTPGQGSNVVSPVITDNYDLVYGSWPESYDQVVLVLDRRGSVSADVLLQLGYLSREQYDKAKEAIENKEEPEDIRFSYEDLLDKTFYLIPACDRYRENEDGTFTYIGDGPTEREELLENALEIKISGIIKPEKGNQNLTVLTSMGYTSLLTDHIIEYSNNSAIIKAQEKSPDINVITGMHFEAASDDQKREDAKAYINTLGISEKASLYSLIMYYQAQEAEGEEGGEETGGGSGSYGSIPAPVPMGESQMAEMLDIWLAETPDDDILFSIYDQYVAGSTYEENMSAFGKVSYDAPSSISIYTDSFEDKDLLAEDIQKYNDATDDEAKKIVYTDYVALITSSITSIVDVISYVLIAFVAVSLIVSSIMIGIITHISVLERTKEIGILRALGASKRNVSQVFNAETVIIGLFAGVLGVGVSMLLTIPINKLIHSLLDDSSLSAVLPIRYGIILIIISIIITVIGGLIPSRKAAKMDPAIALRTE